MASDILVKIGADISDFSRKMSEAQRSMQGIANKMNKVGSKLTKGVTLPLAGVATAAIKTGMDFESGMSKVEAISGASGKQLEALKKKARDMGATTQFSAKEASDAMSYMAMAGWDTEQMLAGIDGAMNLAAASGEDLATVSDIVTDSLTAFGMAAEDSGAFADMLAAASSNANTNVGMLGESFKYVAPLAGSLGYSAEDTTKALSLMANAGIKGSQAGTSLKNMMTNLSSPTAEMESTMKDLGISLTDSTGEMKSLDEVMVELRDGFSGLSEEQKAQAASTLFGKQAMSGALAIVNASEEDYNDLSDAISNSDGTAKEMADTMNDNVLGKLKEMKSALEEAGIAIFEALYPSLMLAIDAVKKFADWFSNLNPVLQKVIVGIGALAAAVGPVLVIGSKLVGVVKMITTAVKAMNLAVLMNPYVALAAAAIAAVVLIIKYWEPIKEFFISLWEGIKTAGIAIWEFLKEVWAQYVEFFMSVWEPIIEFFSNLWNSIVEIASNVWEGIKETWQTAVEFLKEVFTPVVEFFSNIWNSVAETMSQIWSTITETLSTVWEGIKTVAQGVWEGIKNVILGPILLLINLVTGNFDELKANLSAIWNNIKSAASKVWNGIKTVISGVVNGVKSVVTSVWKGIKSVTSTVFNAIKSVASSVWNGLKSIVTSVVNGVKSTVSSVWNAIKSTTSSVFNGIKGIASSVWNGIKNTVTGIVEGAKDTVIGVWEGLKDTTSSIFDGMKSVITNPLEAIDLLSIGKDIISGLVDGIKSKISAVTGAVKDVTSKITGKIKGILGIASPSKLMKQYGRWTGEGLELGIDDMNTKVAKAAARMADAATPDVPEVALGYSTPSRRGLSMDLGNTELSADRNARNVQGGINQNITVNSPKPTSPSENARKMKQASRELAMKWRR